MNDHEPLNQEETQAVPSKQVLTNSPLSNLLPILLVSLGICLVVSLSVTYFYHQHYATRIMSIDLKGYTEKEKDKILAGEISLEEYAESLKAIKAQISALPSNTVVLLKQVVIGENGYELSIDQ